ncbi:MAG: prepilin-type N-terminal cleavage/methylation domain-containing protein [Bacillota bacterium]
MPGRGERGLTLVELIAVTAILAILLLTVVRFEVFGYLAWKDEAGLLELRQELRQAVEIVVRELRLATNVTVYPASVTYTDSSGQSAVIELVDGRLTVRRGSTTATVGRQFTGLSFLQDPDSRLVTVRVTGVRPTGEPVELSGQVALRRWGGS